MGPLRLHGPAFSRGFLLPGPSIHSVWRSRPLHGCGPHAQKFFADAEFADDADDCVPGGEGIPAAIRARASWCAA